jgi:UDP-4-amino-4,6-dideoxy-N-acetyl-beta-L-altrosamine N-acetyltransferase
MNNTIDEVEKNFHFINFKELDEQQKLMILDWRNHESIRKWMYNIDCITLENHLKFMETLKTDSSKVFLLVQRKGQFIGTYSLVNIENNAGEGGFYLSPYLENVNFSVEFCYASFNYVFNKLGIDKITGYALADNRNANSLNSFFGFSQSPVSKVVNGIERAFYYGELTSEKWNQHVKSNPKLLKLVNFSMNQ